MSKPIYALLASTIYAAALTIYVETGDWFYLFLAVSGTIFTTWYFIDTAGEK
jgi:hypothetical protein